MSKSNSISCSILIGYTRPIPYNEMYLTTDIQFQALSNFSPTFTDSFLIHECLYTYVVAVFEVLLCQHFVAYRTTFYQWHPVSVIKYSSYNGVQNKVPIMFDKKWAGALEFGHFAVHTRNTMGRNSSLLCMHPHTNFTQDRWLIVLGGIGTKFPDFKGVQPLLQIRLLVLQAARRAPWPATKLSCPLSGKAKSQDLSTALLKLPIPNVPSPVPLPLLIKSGFQAKPVTHLIPTDVPFISVVEITKPLQSGSFS